MKLARTLYNYQAAKKIYFSNSSSKCYLFEKKETSSPCVCELLHRNTVVVDRKTGIVIYKGKNRF